MHYMFCFNRVTIEERSFEVIEGVLSIYLHLTVKMMPAGVRTVFIVDSINVDSMCQTLQVVQQHQCIHL